MANNNNGAPQSDIEKLRELIKDIRIAMIVGTNSEGKLVSRPMWTQETEFDGDLWFMTGKDTEMAKELSAAPRVNVAYAQTDKNAYISISGTAEILNDRQKIREFWNAWYKTWFEGPEDPNIRLIKIHVESAEYWEAPTNPVVKLLGFVKVLTGTTPDMGENKTLDMK